MHPPRPLVHSATDQTIRTRTQQRCAGGPSWSVFDPECAWRTAGDFCEFCLSAACRGLPHLRGGRKRSVWL